MASWKGDGRPGLVVFNIFKKLIRTLRALTYSKRHPEDIDESCEQHAVDALRYGLGREPLMPGRVPVRF